MRSYPSRNSTANGMIRDSYADCAMSGVRVYVYKCTHTYADNKIHMAYLIISRRLACVPSLHSAGFVCFHRFIYNVYTIQATGVFAVVHRSNCVFHLLFSMSFARFLMNNYMEHKVTPASDTISKFHFISFQSALHARHIYLAWVSSFGKRRSADCKN